ncbi:hypothetical protein BSKO_03149 [Bryopsis sp. KO-2023]|nr:hypothetical protein BSKO_03149 [Bryopsis sp. KO-2023]
MALLGNGTFATLENVTFSDNISGSGGRGAGGGAIWGMKMKSLKISRCMFYRNQAVERPVGLEKQEGTFVGGALLLQGIPKVLIETSTFTHNRATVSAGAIWILTQAVESGDDSFKDGVTATRKLDDDQMFSRAGGAIFLVNVSKIVITNSSFAHNEAKAGGGIFVRDGMLLIEGSSFHDNVALKLGGAIDLEFTNTTIIKSNLTRNIGNEAGGAIQSFGSSAAEVSKGQAIFLSASETFPI